MLVLEMLISFYLKSSPLSFFSLILSSSDHLFKATSAHVKLKYGLFYPGLHLQSGIRGHKADQRRC